MHAYTGRQRIRAPGVWQFCSLLTVPLVALLCLLTLTVTAHAFGNTQCAASRKGSDLGCTANDVSITGIALAPGSPTSCIGGSTFPVDLDVTVNFQVPDRWDIGIFLANDGKDPLINDPTASCSVAILPTTSPFLNLDPGPWSGVLDTCGDGNGTIGGGTSSGILRIPGVPVSCQAINLSGGKLYIPFIVSWDNQSSPSGDTCTSIADPVPNTVSKCNSPKTSVAAEVAYGTVNTVVLPTISKTDGITVITPGAATTYTVVITNTTGVPLSGAVFTDPAVTNLTANSVSCSPAGGATCPAGVTIAAIQGAGITIPAMPVNSSVTFTINATLAAAPSPAGIGSVTNTAYVTVSGQTNSASDTDSIRAKITVAKNLVPASDSGTFNLLVNATPVASAIGHNGSGTTFVTPGAITLSETGAGATNLANYITTYSCTDGTSGAGATLSLTAAAGQIITCTFTNTGLPSIMTVKSVSPAAAKPGDILTYTVQVINSGGPATAVTLTDSVSPYTALRTKYNGTDSTPFKFTPSTSGLTLIPGAALSYSSDNGTSFVPGPPADLGGGFNGSITNWKIIFSDTMNPSPANFILEYQMTVK